MARKPTCAPSTLSGASISSTSTSRSVLPPAPRDPLRTTGRDRLARDLAPLVAARVADHEVVDRAAERLVRGVAEERGGRRVPVGHPLVGVHDDHRHRAVLDEGLELGQPPARLGELRGGGRVRVIGGRAIARHQLDRRGQRGAPPARGATPGRSRRRERAQPRDRPLRPRTRPAGRATRALWLRTSGRCPSACAQHGVRRPRRPRPPTSRSDSSWAGASATNVVDELREEFRIVADALAQLVEHGVVQCAPQFRHCRPVGRRAYRVGLDHGTAG